MTTPAHSDLAYTLTKYYFGEAVASIIKTLYDYDQASLRLLKYNLPQMKFSEIKRSLLLLVKYQLVDYSKTVKNFSQQYEYSVVPHRIFSFFRIQKFVHMISVKEGVTAGLLVSCIMERALIAKEKLCQMVVERINKNQNPVSASTNLNSQIDDLLQRLILKRYIVQFSSNVCVNFDRFSRCLRDDMVVDTIFNHYSKDTKIKHLCRTIIDLTIENTPDDALLTAPCPLLDLASSLIPHVFTDKTQLEKYLNLLSSEGNNRFIPTCGTHPNKGPMYAVHVGSVIDYLVKEHLSSVIATRWGPKCSRVFRVLLSRGPLLLKQVEEIIMLPAKDVREYSYYLMNENLLRCRQIPKTPDNAPGKSVYILSVEIDTVVHTITDLCCQAMNNLLVRHGYELQQNKILLDKSRECLDANVAQDEWNQYFTSHELSQLERINKTLDKLLLAKAQVDETFFLMHTWLNIRPSLELEELPSY